MPADSPAVMRPGTGHWVPILASPLSVLGQFLNLFVPPLPHILWWLKVWTLKTDHLGSNPSFIDSMLCDVGQVS